MAKWAITYNGFGSNVASASLQWTHVNVTGMQSSPVFAEDSISIESTKHVITGTAMLSANTDSAFATLLLNVRTRLSSQPIPTSGSASATAFYIYVDGEDHAAGAGNATDNTEIAAGGFSRTGDSQGVDAACDTNQDGTGPGFEKVVHYVGSGDDDYGLPTCEYNINEIAGTRTAIVAFTITWHKIEPPNSSINYDVLSHVWSQSYDIGNSGYTTMTITGTLKTRFFSPVAGKNEPDGLPSESDSPFQGMNPDSYRYLVMPAIPVNFRLESMKWSTDKPGTTLSYTIVFKEHARALPGAALVGSGSFSYRRGLDAKAFMGIKTFEGELEGGPKSDPTELLSSLIRCAASRIYFGGGVGPGDDVAIDMITSIEVTEKDIFSRKKISLRINAHGLQTTDPTGDPGYNLLKPFVPESMNYNIPPPVWGSQLISSVKRQLWFPWNPCSSSSYTGDDFPQAQWRTLDNAEGLGAEDGYVSETVGVGTIETPLEHGEDSGANIDATGHRNKPYVRVEGTESIEVNNNFVIMSGQSLNAFDSVYQMGKPTVTIISEYQLTRVGTPPDRLMMTKPKNGLIMSETFDVNRGQLDGNNNRQYIGLYRRVVRLLFNSDASYFYDARINLPGWGMIEVVAWWPTDGLAAPVDPRIEPDPTGSGEIVRTLYGSEVGRDGGGSSSSVWKLGKSPNPYGS
jgi:hypothetical protein